MRRTLKIFLLSLTVIGLVAIFGVFTESLSPSDKAKSERSQHNIKTLKIGTYLLVDFERQTAWKEKILIIKDWSGALYVHILPTENEGISLPDRYWGWAVYSCKIFGPETGENGSIVKNGYIKCHDKDTPNWVDTNRWIWSYSGKAQHEWLPDMRSPKYEINDDTLIING